MDMWQLLGLKKILTVEEAAQLWTRTRRSGVAEDVIKDAIEAGDLAAEIERWGVYYPDLGTELPEGNINQHETTVKRTDFDTWLKAIGQSITGPRDIKPETGDEPQGVGVGDTAQEEPQAGEDSVSDREPSLHAGHKNNRDAVKGWVHWQAYALKVDGDIADTLVERIWHIADKFKYGSERSNDGESMTKATILKLLPEGVTGGRGKNRGRSKTGWPDYGKGTK